MEKLTLGKIIKTKGLDGTVKVFSSTDFASERYKKGNKVLLQNPLTKELIEVTVRRYYFDQGFDYVSFEEYPTIESITPFINGNIYVDKQNIKPLDKDTYFFSDLESCLVLDKVHGEIGKVTSVDDFSGRRSLRIKLKNGKDLLLPFVNAFIQDVDIDKKIINVTLIDGMID